MPDGDGTGFPDEFNLGDDPVDDDTPPNPFDQPVEDNPDSPDFNPDLLFSDYNTGLMFSQAYDDFLETGDQFALDQFLSGMVTSGLSTDLDEYNNINFEYLFDQLQGMGEGSEPTYFRPSLNRMRREYQMNLRDVASDFTGDRTRKFGQAGLTFGSGFTPNLDDYSIQAQTLASDFRSKRRGFFSDVGGSFWDIVMTTLENQLGD